MPITLPTFIRTAALAAVALAPLAASAQGTAMPSEQRKAIGEIVREYLIANPEVIQEALQELEKRQAEAQRATQREALTASREALEKSPNDFVVGNPNGDITLVEFFDYNCGYCKRALGDLRQLVAADPRLKIVLKDFPVLGPESLEAARVALAARRQLKGDKLFDFHATLIESRGRINAERGLEVAKEFGLDLARLKKDIDGPHVKAAIQENVLLGDRLGLTGTPAFILGDEIISGAGGAEPLTKAIASTRQCGKAVC